MSSRHVTLDPMTAEADRLLVEVARNSDPLMRHDEYGAALYPVADEDDPHGAPVGYVIWWTDHVVNEWAEFTPALPVALARFGALIDAAARGAFYVRPLPDFAADVRALFDKHAT